MLPWRPSKWPRIATRILIRGYWRRKRRENPQQLLLRVLRNKLRVKGYCCVMLKTNCKDQI